MKFSDFLIESNVNSLINSANKVLFKTLDTEIKQVLQRHRSKYDAHDPQPFIDAIKPDLIILSSGVLNQIEGEFKHLATAEVEERFGKIMSYHRAKHEPDFDATWKHLWWIGNIIVWFQNKNSDLKTSGYFQSSSSEVLKKFPDELTKHIDPFKESCVGINVSFDKPVFKAQLKNAVIESVADGELDIDLKVDDRLNELLVNIVDTFAHEVTHLLQYIKQNLSTHAKRTQGNYQQKNYLGADIKKIHEVISAESSTWTEKDWGIYLSSAIEIDAHAVSVASKVIQLCKHKYPSAELKNLSEVMNELRTGYVYSSKSFDFYSSTIQQHVKSDRRYQKVWQRFLKKVAAQLLDRIEHVQAKVTAEEAMYM